MDESHIQSIGDLANVYLGGTEKHDSPWKTKRQNLDDEAHDYIQLHPDDDEASEQVNSRRQRRVALFIPLLSTILITLLVVYTLESLTGLRIDDHVYTSDADVSRSGSSISDTSLLGTPSSPPITILHCGNSSTDARRLGCIFQLWSYAWVPPACYDADLDADFLLLQSGKAPADTNDMMAGWPAETTGWSYFSDEVGTASIPLETVINGESEMLHTTWLQHLWHCAFTWRKILKSLNGSGVKLTERDLSLDHTSHCSEMAVNGGVWAADTINDRLVLGFLHCQM